MVAVVIVAKNNALAMLWHVWQHVSHSMLPLEARDVASDALKMPSSTSVCAGQQDTR